MREYTGRDYGADHILHNGGLIRVEPLEDGYRDIIVTAYGRVRSDNPHVGGKWRQADSIWPELRDAVQKLVKP